MRFYKLSAAIFLTLAASLCVEAHEYWLEPDRFFLKAGESTPVRMFVGERLKAEEERPFQASKTSLMKMFSSGGEFNLIGTGRDGEVPLFSFSSDREGTFLFAVQRSWSYITLTPEQFAEYLREDGMEYILAEREKLGQSAKEAKERYSRYLKSLVQVGEKRDKTFSGTVGLAFEIIPLENPYDKKPGSTLRVRFVFRGKPMPGKAVFADIRNSGKIDTRQYKTDSAGIATIDLPASGICLVRAVHMERCEKACEGADWQSYWAALTFAIK